MLGSSPSAFARLVYLRNLSLSAPLRLSRALLSLSRRTLVFVPSRISSSPWRDLRGFDFPSFVSSSPATPLRFSRFASEMASQSSHATQTVHDFTVKDARGNDVDLSIYKGKVLLIVNVASQCGLTNSNYTELSTLYEKYKDKGLEILAFPCNQFGAQEPGTNEQILEFACTRFKAEYPIFDKVDVNGNNAAPIYKFLKSSKGGLFGDSIKWNFSKFLVDKEGHVVDRYAPTTSPLSIEKDVKKLLGPN